MDKQIIINAAADEVRVAVLENSKLAEFFIERTKEKRVAGNIYKGKVVKVLPGMQSAFIDLGLPKAAFLHVADLYLPSPEELPIVEEEEPHHGGDEHDDDELDEPEEPAPQQKKGREKTQPIEKMLSEGQEIIVQVAKEAIGQKGARLTSHLTLPGRYLVLMPGYDHMGVSRKIEDEKERDRLRDILRNLKPKGIGLIARTVSAGHKSEEIIADLEYLLRIWRKFGERIATSHAPALVYEDHDLLFKTLRDITTDDVSRIVIDSKPDFLKMKNMVRDLLPDVNVDIDLYEDSEPIFEHHGIENELNKSLDKRVWLKSGGYLIIDQAEALTVIDINTGRYVGKKNFDETILKTNLDAAVEIAWQIRLRNIGGIIIVDFIDMETEEHKDKVLKTLESALKGDRAKASVVSISPLGLVEITRKRVQESLARTMSESCPYCEGRGIIRSRQAVSHQIMRDLRSAARVNFGGRFMVECHPDITNILKGDEKEFMMDLEMMHNITIDIKSNENLHREHFEVIPLEQK